MSRPPRFTTFLSRLATLAAVVAPARPGTTSPGASGPFASAPAGAPEAFPLSRSRLRASLRACTTEGLFAEVVSACAGGAVLTGWAIHLGAGPFLTGFVVALPQLAQLFQVPAAWTTALLGHRRACVWMVGASRQALLPLLALPYLPLSVTGKQGLLVGVALLSAILGVLGNNAWVAWMADLVPRRMRGRYFGRRTGLCTLGGAAAAAGAGALLDGRTLARGDTLAVLALCACAAGVVTTLLMLRMHDPAPQTPPLAMGWQPVLAPYRDRGVRALLAYQTVWNLAVGLAGSFFALHMLRNLRMGFTLVALHGTAVALARMFSAPLWGRLLDRFGARPVLVTSSLGISLLPFVWLTARPDWLWPLAVDALVTGALWSGHGLALFALPLTVAPRPNRPFYLAAFATAGGLAFAVGTAAGGFMAERLGTTVTLLGRARSPLELLFVVSGLLRLCAGLLALQIAEPAARGVGAMWAALLGRRAR